MINYVAVSTSNFFKFYYHKMGRWGIGGGGEGGEVAVDNS